MAHDYLILHGVNLNMFGKRDPEQYGTISLDSINAALTNLAKRLGVQLAFYQTNSEGSMIERIHAALDDGTKGIIINAGAWTHYSYALLDALLILHCPIIEVHMSHIAVREKFRQTSVIAPACCGAIQGFGVNSYLLGLLALNQRIRELSEEGEEEKSQGKNPLTQEDRKDSFFSL